MWQYLADCVSSVSSAGHIVFDNGRVNHDLYSDRNLPNDQCFSDVSLLQGT